MCCCLLGSRATVNDAVAYMDVGKGREQDAVALRRESSCSPIYFIRSGEICCFQNKETAIG